MYLLNILIDEQFSLNITVSIWVYIPLCIIIIISIISTIIVPAKIRFLEIDEAELGIGNQKIKIRPNHIDSQVAFKIWIEINTRKIALPIDFENDIIYEIYKSWYSFFGIAREHLKEVPINMMTRKSTKNIVDIAIKILNQCLRPHLTKWHGKFNKWYNVEVKKEENTNIDPQELQKKYPYYDDLIKDMQSVNDRLIFYKKLLNKIVIG